MIFQYWIMICGMVVCQSSGQPPDGVPVIPTFPTKRALFDSAFWSDVTKSKKKVTDVTVIVSEGDRFLQFKEIPPMRWWKKMFSDTEAEFLEIKLGKVIPDIETNFNPLATVSAIYSSSVGVIERERLVSRSITFNGGICKDCGILGAIPVPSVLAQALALAASIAFKRTYTLRVSNYMACRAPSGKRVQLQASHVFAFYPNARIRRAAVMVRTKEFKAGEWFSLLSSIGHERVDGALFYKPQYTVMRCVTDENEILDEALSLRSGWLKEG